MTTCKCYHSMLLLLHYASGLTAHYYYHIKLKLLVTLALIITLSHHRFFTEHPFLYNQRDPLKGSHTEKVTSIINLKIALT